jgi:Protein of unknown function (DUF2975)
MNTNLIASTTSNVRLKRIKNSSRSLKVMLLLYLGCLVASQPYFFQFIHKTRDGWTMFAGTYATFAEIPWCEKSLAFLSVGIFIGAILTGYQLLGLYEQGIIFSARNVRLLRRIGLLAISYGVLAGFGRTLVFAWYHYIGSSPSGYFLTGVACDFFALLSSPWIIGGFFVVVISYIMGEGRKLQEEQELTV